MPRFGALAILLFSLNTHASVSILRFEDVYAPPGPAPCFTTAGTGFTEAGYTISRLTENFFVCNGSADLRGFNSNGTDAFQSREFRLSRTDRQPFSLVELELGESRLDPTGEAIYVDLFGQQVDGGSVSTRLTLDLFTSRNPLISGFEVFTLPSEFTNLVSVTFIGSPISPTSPGSFFSDNIKLRVVPVPAGVWLFASGLVLLIRIRRMG